MANREGTFEGGISKCGAGEFDGVQKVFMEFIYQDGENMEHITWWGRLIDELIVVNTKKTTPKEMSLDTMFVAGWNGDIDSFAKGEIEKAFPAAPKVYLNIKKNGEYFNVYVNATRGGLDPEKAKGILNGLKADILAAKERAKNIKRDAPTADKKW